MTEIHYVYYSYEEWGRGYIGKRKCPIDKTPESDEYLGSYKDKTFKPTHKIILGVFDSNEEALNAEILLHKFYKVDANPHFANKAKQTSKKFTTCGQASWNKGLKGKNILKGWNKGLKLSPLTPEHKQKISRALKNRKVLDSTREKIRKQLKNKPKTSSHKQALRDAKQKKIYSWINKNLDIVVLDVSIPELMRLYPETLKVKSCLYYVALGKKPQYKGWYLYSNQQPSY